MDHCVWRIHIDDKNVGAYFAADDAKKLNRLPMRYT